MTNVTRSWQHSAGARFACRCRGGRGSEDSQSGSYAGSCRRECRYKKRRGPLTPGDHMLRTANSRKQGIHLAPALHCRLLHLCNKSFQSCKFDPVAYARYHLTHVSQTLCAALVHVAGGLVISSAGPKCMTPHPCLSTKIVLSITWELDAWSGVVLLGKQRTTCAFGRTYSSPGELRRTKAGSGEKARLPDIVSAAETQSPISWRRPPKPQLKCQRKSLPRFRERISGAVCREWPQGVREDNSRDVRDDRQ
ncbi:MAG: hypothetical protein BJ554DRAFT_5367 [Olpidium bornovanus]|uniref:Uncharacterized protein n=1 Tax=Olpidium bornovanus TaxID=278681 RepID=A0A8H8DLK0_9FUNG|nr:MAG: hypothetical protein BJ554DRAFT_5367 [Olpidium bornovanus]